MLEGARLDHQHRVPWSSPRDRAKAKDATWHSENDEAFEDKTRRLAAEWREQVTEARRLNTAIEANLRSLGFPSLEDRPSE